MKILLIFIYLNSFFLFSQSENSKFIINSSCISNNSANFIVGINDVKLTFFSSEKKLISKKKVVAFYPNPVDDGITIVNLENIKTADVYNPLGQLITRKEVLNNFLDLKELNAGFYIIIVQNGNSFKIIKN